MLSYHGNKSLSLHLFMDTYSILTQWMCVKCIIYEKFWEIEKSDTVLCWL